MPLVFMHLFDAVVFEAEGQTSNVRPDDGQSDHRPTHSIQSPLISSEDDGDSPASTQHEAFRIVMQDQ